MKFLRPISLLTFYFSLLISASAVAADYNIVSYGAKSDTTVLSTTAIQRAIDDCSKACGGRVVVPAGNYKIGTIVLKNDVHLYLEKGATLYGSTDLNDYRPMKSDFVSLRTQVPTIQLIYADKVKNVQIDGEGTIDGQGWAFKKLSWNDEGITRPHLIRFIQGEEITVKDITLKNSGCWMQHYLACRYVRIENLKIYNRNNYNNDGLDIDGCSGVFVKGLMVDSDDDGITLKSTSPLPCQDVYIEDCVVSSHCNAVKLGTETNGGFLNIHIKGIVVRPSSDQSSQFFGAPSKIGTSALSLEIVDGGQMLEVHVSDFTVEGTESPIFIRLGNRGRGYKLREAVKGLSGTGNDDTIAELIPINHVGRINGVHVSHFRVRNAGSVGCSITGLPNYPVENVWLSDISIHHKGGVKAADLAAINDTIRDEKEKAYPEATMWGNLPAKGFFVRHARNVVFDDVQIQAEQSDVRPDFVQDDYDPEPSSLSFSWGDLGNGFYKNPVLNADFSDPDVIRVGAKYYMVASDFHFLGMQVLESEDMVNWRYISQIYRRFDEPGWDSNQHYAGGSWAPAIRYHDGLYYVFFCTPDEGLYMSTAKDPHGPWASLHLVKRVPKWEDPCPFWDDDGQAYLGRSKHGAGPIIVHKMSPDGKQLLDEGVTVYEGPVAEGTKFLKRNGWYYLVIPEGGVGSGWQTVLRSRNIYGPYERKIVLEQGSTHVNGPHQGALVNTPDGTWWFYHFQETPVLGRVVHLQPVRWQDDWPLMGVDYDGNGVGEPVDIWQKPGIEVRYKRGEVRDYQYVSNDFRDDFNGINNSPSALHFPLSTLSPVWQWNHNPVDTHWNLTDRKGWLTLKALPADSLKLARNMLTQKVIGYQSESTTLVSVSGISYGGLFCSGKLFRGIGLCKEGVFVEAHGERQIISRGKFDMVWLRIENNCTENCHQFYYSTDGEHYEPAGEEFPMRAGYWKGIRVGLFCYGPSGEAAFDFFEQRVAP
ncbi:MAG: family 43 glycosylhydrolase [Prevotella sp.]|nr:family 43 glycosylhydrolase [Prevotella sp.]